MKQLRTSPAAKAVSVVLAILVMAGGFWSSFFILYQWDAIWSDAGYYDSTNYYNNLNVRYRQVARLIRLDYLRETNGSLSYLDAQEERDLAAELAPDSTNFRFRVVRNDTGAVVRDNLERQDMESIVHAVSRESQPLTPDDLDSDDYLSWDGVTSTYLLHVATPDGVVIFTQTDAHEAEQYGWLPQSNNWLYSEALDTRGKTVEYALEYGVADPLEVDDAFREGLLEYAKYSSYLPLIALLALALDCIAVALFIFLCRAAGHRRGEAAICRNDFDKLPLDVLLALEVGAIALLFVGGDAITYHFNYGPTIETVVGLAMVTVAIIACLLALLLTVATRCKTHTLFSNTLIGRLCRAIGRWLGRTVAGWPMTRRTVGLFLLYLVGTALTGLTIFLIPFYQGFVLWALCRWVRQWRAIRAGTVEIVGGSPGYKIDTAKMYRDLKEHADQLNDLGGAIGSAVDEQMRSERFKAELITNVSHDLKTPLTSIINYVDLLKKQDIDNPTAAEYIEVLDRKSQRLKKLTEDLVEASKASTGNLTVNRERLSMVQLAQQALGEFEEKFSAKELEAIAIFPNQEAYVEADGRHLWRIIDNLLSNCNKYALEHTRVYLDVIRWDGSVTLSVKNISKQPLNIPPEQLMERFVRGEEARATEGSGLGLSIARSLTELQGGTFRLTIDGDLFKASVTFPEAPLSVPPQPVLSNPSTPGQ